MRRASVRVVACSARLDFCGSDGKSVSLASTRQTAVCLDHIVGAHTHPRGLKSGMGYEDGTEVAGGLEEEDRNDSGPVIPVGKTLLNGEKAKVELAELGLVDQASPLTPAELIGIDSSCGM